MSHRLKVQFQSRSTSPTRTFCQFLMQVGFTFSQATKALRESRGIALLYFSPLHQKGVRGQRHAQAAPYPRERPGTHCTGGWVGLRAGLDRCGDSRPTGIQCPDRPARRQSLYRLRYPAHSFSCKLCKICERVESVARRVKSWAPCRPGD